MRGCLSFPGPCLLYRSLLNSVLLRGKGGKLRGQGGAKLYRKVFSDMPPLLEAVAEVRWGRQELSGELYSSAAGRRVNIFPARFEFIEPVRPPQ